MMSSVRRFIAMLAILGIVGAAASPACAALVSGTLTGAASGGRQIHFENRVTHDLFLLSTDPDGKFSVDLPPGSYDLRGDRGAIIGSPIVVDESDLALGKIAGSDGWGASIFHREGVLEGLVATPAPSTANLPSIEAEATEPGTPMAPPAPAPKQSQVPLLSTPASSK